MKKGNEKEKLTDVITQEEKSVKTCHECGINIIGNPWYRFVKERGISKSVPVCDHCSDPFPHGAFVTDTHIIPFKSEDDSKDFDTIDKEKYNQLMDEEKENWRNILL